MAENSYAAGKGAYEYSRWDTASTVPGTVGALDENALNEAAGLAGTLRGYWSTHSCSQTNSDWWRLGDAVDFNCDGDTKDTAVSSSVNKEKPEKVAKTILTPGNDWARLSFKGGAVGAGEDPPQPLTTPRPDEPEPSKEDLLEQVRTLFDDAAGPKLGRVKAARRGRRVTLRLRATDKTGVGHFIVSWGRTSENVRPRRQARSASATKRLKLRRGRHVVSITAVDTLGNASRRKRVTVRVR